MSNHYRMRLKFWGVRGSTPTPAAENLAYGGNTPCLEVRFPDNRIFVFDAGTGIRNLGLSLGEEFGYRDLSVKIFLTHFHWDHIQGLPFFEPLYHEGCKAAFYAFSPQASLQEMLKGQMKSPYFPVEFEFMAARKDYVNMGQESMHFGEVSVHPFPLHHPQGAFGYRIESGSAVIVYASDLEHGDPKLDKTVREYSEGADILIFDSQFTPQQYRNHQGWGHSTWLEATKVARDSNVKRLFLFHHHPSHDDRTFSRLVEEARAHFGNTDGAREGQEFDL